jgi:hypothetical protein
MAELPVPGPGRDSVYDPSMNDAARKLALLGLTNDEMAEFFGVHPSTFYRWMNEYSAFCEAVNEGKVIADANVAESLYKRATGEHVEVEKVYTNRNTGEKATIKVMTYIPGEAPAALNWLKNRRPLQWREKQEVQHTGEVVHKIERLVVRPNSANTDR